MDPSYYGYSMQMNSFGVLSLTAEFLSLVFVIGAFLILAYLALRVKTRKSFQFEMFLFALVLGAAEVPHIVLDISGLDLGPLVTYGLEVHSISMVILASFVAYRVYGFFKGKVVAAK